MNINNIPEDTLKHHIVPYLIDSSAILKACDQENKDKTSIEAFFHFSCTSKRFNRCCKECLPSLRQLCCSYKNIFTYFKNHYQQGTATLLQIVNCTFLGGLMTSDNPISFRIYLSTMPYDQNNPTHFLNFELITRSSNNQLLAAVDKLKSTPCDLLSYLLNNVKISPKERQQFKDYIDLFQSTIKKYADSPKKEESLIINTCNYPCSLFIHAVLLDGNSHELLAEFLFKYGFSNYVSLSWQACQSIYNT
jgi:hypothetical protein